MRQHTRLTVGSASNRIGEPRIFLSMPSPPHNRCVARCPYCNILIFKYYPVPDPYINIYIYIRLVLIYSNIPVYINIEFKIKFYALVSRIAYTRILSYTRTIVLGMRYIIQYSS